MSSGARSSALNLPVFVKGIVLSANEVIGGEEFTATVILNQPAPAGGLAVTVTKNSTDSPLTTSDPAFKLALDVNGTSDPVTFPPLSKITTTSNGTSTTGNVSLRVPLKAGPNVVRLLTTEQGGPTIDKLTVAAP